MLWFILFVFGLAIGSFLNVVALRYDGEKFVFDSSAIGGRSHCPHCGKTLRWFELVPLASFIVQGGKCRRCGACLSFRYPITELISGAIFAFVPWRIMTVVGVGGPVFLGLSAFWLAAFEVLFLMALIDIRLGIIPDELNLALFVLGIFFCIFMAGYLGLANHSFFGAYAAPFGLQDGLWLNRAAAAVFAGAFFGLLIFVTRGKGMGMGDLKLAVPLGFFLGWPDIFFAAACAFVLGAAAGLIAIAAKKKTMKGSLPFGPFLAIGAAIVFFWGYQAIAWYLGLF